LRNSPGPRDSVLKAESGSCFDKYLDEILYYFEISRRDIVVFEDLDRFDNVEIFETLRALNTLLNGSAQVLKQTQGRKLGSIRFIYALRDSVFEKLGTGSMEETNADHTPGPIDEAQAEVQRANRTKFFDLVVPVVPFITHKNARDLMTEAMQGTGVTSGLIDLAAGHVADMRLISIAAKSQTMQSVRYSPISSPTLLTLKPPRLKRLPAPRSISTSNSALRN